MIQKDSDYPPRKELRARLQSVADAIDVVRGSLRDFEVSTLLLSTETGFEHQNEMDHALRNYAEKVSKVLNEIRPGPGRNKHYASAGLSCLVNCALMVSLMWERVHREWPPVNNNTAQEACAELWAASGGDTTRLYGTTKDTRSVVVWRDYLRDAKAATDSPEAELIKRSLDAIPGK
jgi:hypothetical protein